MNDQCISSIEKMGVEPTMSYKLEHDIILFISKLEGHFFCCYTVQGPLHVGFEASDYSIKFPHGRVDVWADEGDLFIHCLINLCGKMWDYLTEVEQTELKNILEGRC